MKLPSINEVIFWFNDPKIASTVTQTMEGQSHFTHKEIKELNKFRYDILKKLANIHELN